MTITKQPKHIATFLTAALVASTATWGAVAFAAEHHFDVDAPSVHAVEKNITSHQNVGKVKDKQPQAESSTHLHEILGHPVRVSDIDVPDGGYLVSTSSYNAGDRWVKYVPQSAPWRIVEAYYEKDTLMGVQTRTQTVHTMPHVQMVKGWWKMEDPATTPLEVFARWNDGQTGDIGDPLPPLSDLANDVMGSLFHTATTGEERRALLTLLSRMPGAQAAEVTIEGRRGVELSWEHNEWHRQVIVVASDNGEIIATRSDSASETGLTVLHSQQGVAHVDGGVVAQQEKWRSAGECYTAPDYESCGQFNIDQ